MKPASMVEQITAAGLDRAVPHFTVYVRAHNAKKCKYVGEFRSPQNSKCTCRKSLRTHYKNKLYRESAFTRTWEAAEAEGRRMVAELERRRAGGGLALVATQVSSPGQGEHRDLAAWVTLFLETLTDQTQGVRDTYKRQLKSMLAFFDAQVGRAAVPADILQPNIMVKFKATLADLDPATQSKFQQRVKKFLKYLNGNGALAYVPLLEPIKQDPNKESKLPLEDVQYDALLATIPTISNGRSQAVRALALLMRHTALAIHDASNLQRSAFSQDEHGWIMATNRQKTGKPVSVPVPRTIAEELLNLPDVNGGFFFERRGADAHATADAWGNDLGKVFKKVGLDWPKYGTHSLRHTFACVKLVDGFSYEQVGVWMGDAAEMIERTYSRMINKRWQDSHAKARGGADFIAHN